MHLLSCATASVLLMPYSCTLGAAAASLARAFTLTRTPRPEGRLLTAVLCLLCCALQAHSFELELDTTGFSEYVRGGIVTQHKEPKVRPSSPSSSSADHTLEAAAAAVQIFLWRQQQQQHAHVQYSCCSVWAGMLISNDTGNAQRPCGGTVVVCAELLARSCQINDSAEVCDNGTFASHDWGLLCAAVRCCASSVWVRRWSRPGSSC
jgi:hypothetical protein